MKNRTIEFRAWDERMKVMIATGFNVIGEATMFGAIELHIMKHTCDVKSSFERFNDIIITQFTGLHDRNGKKIFEGDILSQTEKTNYRFGDYGVVEYETDYAGFIVKGKYRKNQHHALLSCDVAIDCEVIGSIFETPNLIP